MIFWWCALGLILAAVYMVTYTLLRTSADNRRWHERLRRPNGSSADPSEADQTLFDGP